MLVTGCIVIGTIVRVRQVNSAVELFLGDRKAPSSKADSVAHGAIGKWPFLVDNPTKGVGTIEGIVNHFGKKETEGKHGVIIGLATIIDRRYILSNF